MGNLKVMVDDTLLDNGTTRRIVGFPTVAVDPAGRMDEFQCEIIIQSTTANGFDTIYDSTFDDISKLNARLRVWWDDSKVTPSFDWNVGDGLHTDIVTSVQILADESRTQKKFHCLFRAVAMKQLDLSSALPPATDSPLPGLASKIEITKISMESDRYHLSASGSFKSTLNPAVEGPFDLVSVTNQSGKARFTLQSGTISAAYDATAGQFIDVGSPSAYQGRHFITGITTGNIIDTTTLYVSAEGDVNATLLFGNTTSADAAFESAKGIILEDLLETGEAGSPNATAPHMCKVSQSLAYSSERKEFVDFILVSGPAPMATTTDDGSGNPAERGLQFSIKYVPPEMWNEGYAPMRWGVLIMGKCAISEAARATNADLGVWFDQIKEQIATEVAPDIARRTGGAFREHHTEFTVDYSTNDCTFVIMGSGNYTGTLSYSRTVSTDERQPRTIYRNTDGTMPVHEPLGPTDKVCVIQVRWIGDAGSAPPRPLPPQESGFEYLFDGAAIASSNNLTDEAGNQYLDLTVNYTYTRILPVGSGGAIAGGVGATGGAGGQSSGNDNWVRGGSGPKHLGQFG